MAQTFYPITPVDVTPGTAGSWQDVDLSSHIPAGGTGALFHILAIDGRSFGFRKNGSTDDRYVDLGEDVHTWAGCGVDGDRICEIKVQSTTNVTIYLVAYTVARVTWNTNGVDKTPATEDSWQDMDCSSEAPDAIGLLFEIISGAGVREVGLRKNGSTDNRTTDVVEHHMPLAIIGCDAGQVCEGYRESGFGGDPEFYLLGCITAGAVFNTNATDLSLSTTGSWLDLSALPAGVMGFIEVTSSAAYAFGLRKNGSAETIYYDVYKHCWACMECDASQLIEGKIENVAVDFFEVGHAEAGAVSSTLVQGVLI